MTFPKRGTKIVRTQGPRPALRLGVPTLKAAEPVAAAPAETVEACVCAPERTVFARMDSLNLVSDPPRPRYRVLGGSESLVSIVTIYYDNSNQRASGVNEFIADVSGLEATWVAVVEGELCGNVPEWDIVWTPATNMSSTAPFDFTLTNGRALAVSIQYRFYQAFGPSGINKNIHLPTVWGGLLTLTPTVCEQTLNPVSISVEASTGYY